MTARAILGLALAAALLAGCGSSGPSASDRSAGHSWVTGSAGRTWQRREVALREQAERVLGRAGTGALTDQGTGAPAGTDSTGGPAVPLLTWCRTAQDPGNRPAPFPVARVQDALSGASLAEAIRTCATGDLSRARQLAHGQVDRLSHVDQLLAAYR